MKTRLGSGVQFQMTRHAVAGNRHRVRVTAFVPSDTPTEPVPLTGRIVADRDEPSHRVVTIELENDKWIKLHDAGGSSFFIAPFQRLTFVDKNPRRKTQSRPSQ